MDPEEVEPAINDEAIEAMRTGDAAKALDNPITLKAKNNVTATLNKPEISQFTSIEKKDGKLKLAVDTNRAQELLAERPREPMSPRKCQDFLQRQRQADHPVRRWRDHRLGADHAGL